MKTTNPIPDMVPGTGLVCREQHQSYEISIDEKWLAKRIRKEIALALIFMTLALTLFASVFLLAHSFFNK